MTDETRRALSVKVIENFEKVVVPEYHQLLSGAIHGDLNEQNILGNFHLLLLWYRTSSATRATTYSLNDLIQFEKMIARLGDSTLPES